MSQANVQFSEREAVQIAWQARREGARWESAVRDYCCVRCGGSEEDARVVIKAVKKVVDR